MRGRVKKTYFYENLRAISVGINETAVSTFLLLILVRYFDASATSKSFIAAAPFIGFILSPFSLHIAKYYSLTSNQTAYLLFLISSAGFILAASFDSLLFYIIGVMLGVVAASMTVPLVTQMYQENFPRSKRGRLVSRTVMVRIFISMIFADLAGRALEGRISNYSILLVVYAASSLFAAYCLLIPSTKKLLSDKLVKNPLSSLRFVKSDKVFRNTLISWFFIGFGNLIMLPLRVEYLANPRYELDLSVSEIALLVAVVPSAAMFIFSPLWGYIFDRYNFFALRTIINLCFALGIAAFFTSSSFNGLLLGSVAYGISFAGGNIAWTLWVTKFAPPGKVADYMTVHAFFTGIRGIAAPFIGFYLISGWTMPQIGLLSLVLIMVSVLILVPEYFALKNKGNSRKKAVL